MDTCVVFCAGSFDRLAQPLAEGDYLIAADGGLRHLEALGIQPHCILGDFDSLGHIPDSSLVFPVEKDDTDSMLAIRQGLSRGYRRFVIYGALDGERLDHTIANLQALQFLADHHAQGVLVGLNQCAVLVQNGGLRFPKEATGIVSVFCMGTAASGVCIRQLQYTLEDGSLTCGFPLGVSNHFIGKESEISVKNGSLLVIFDRSNPFPEVTAC